MTLDLSLHRRLCRYVRRVTGCQPCDAEDAASDAIVVALERGVSRFSYLAVCAVNRQRDRRSALARYEPIAAHAHRLAASSAPDIAVELVQLLAASYELTDAQRCIVELLAQDYAPAEARAALGLSVKQYEWRISAARQALRKRGFGNFEPRRYVGITRFWRKWQAKLKINGKTIYVGLYGSPRAAAEAYDAAARRLLGDRAVLNFPTTAEIGAMG